VTRFRLETALAGILGCSFARPNSTTGAVVGVGSGYVARVIWHVGVRGLVCRLMNRSGGADHDE
jgi:hypothetical protein